MYYLWITNYGWTFLGPSYPNLKNTGVIAGIFIGIQEYVLLTALAHRESYARSLQNL